METFAVKRPNGIFWSPGHTPSQIDDMLAAAEIDERWLICPQGRSDQALEVRDYLADRSVFRRMKEREAADRAAEKAARKATPKPAARVWGERLLGITVVYWLAGRFIVSTFLPHRINQGLGLLEYLILVPFWTMGVVGVVTWLVGWVQHKLRADEAVRNLRLGKVGESDLAQR